MSYYSIVLFIHMIGALGFFMALGLELTSLHQLRSALATLHVSEWLIISRRAIHAGLVAMVVLLASGAYMMVTAWGRVAWVTVAMGPLIPLTVLTLVVTGRRLAAIRRQISAEDPTLSRKLYRSLHSPVLLISIRTRVALAIGVVFLMTVKPSLGAALVAIGAAVALGMASALPTLGRMQAREESGA